MAIRVKERAAALDVRDLGVWWPEAVEVQGRPRRPTPEHACGEPRVGWSPALGPVCWCPSCGEVVGPATY